MAGDQNQESRDSGAIYTLISNPFRNALRLKLRLYLGAATACVGDNLLQGGSLIEWDRVPIPARSVRPVSNRNSQGEREGRVFAGVLRRSEGVTTAVCVASLDRW